MRGNAFRRAPSAWAGVPVGDSDRILAEGKGAHDHLMDGSGTRIPGALSHHQWAGRNTRRFSRRSGNPGMYAIVGWRRAVAGDRRHDHSEIPGAAATPRPAARWAARPPPCRAPWASSPLRPAVVPAAGMRGLGRGLHRQRLVAARVGCGAGGCGAAACWGADGAAALGHILTEQFVAPPLSRSRQIRIRIQAEEGFHVLHPTARPQPLPQRGFRHLCRRFGGSITSISRAAVGPTAAAVIDQVSESARGSTEPGLRHIHQGRQLLRLSRSPGSAPVVTPKRNGATLSLGEDNTLTVNGTGNTLISAVTDGAGGMGSAIIKDGSGTLTITANNAYSGGTIVNGGTLLVNGRGDLGDGNVTVNNSGTLGGNSTSPIISRGVFGNRNARVTVDAGGNLAPGNGGNNTAVLTVNALTLEPASNFRIDINGTTPGIGYDRLVVDGIGQ